MNDWIWVVVGFVGGALIMYTWRYTKRFTVVRTGVFVVLFPVMFFLVNPINDFTTSWREWWESLS